FSPKMTVLEYLEWESKQETRHECLDGEIVAMTGGTIAHNDLALNFYSLLKPHLKKQSCRVNVADVKVQKDQESRYFYPDLVVTCDTEDLQAYNLIHHPKLIVEVLSPSTRGYDRGDKFKYYRAFPSLQEYVLVDSESIFVEVYQRTEGKFWLYSDYSAGDIIHLISIDFSSPIETLYEGVTLPAIADN
ncbi:MAG: Uma2 family endonuclease, partial [Microcystaceae cyanobacterium]